MWLFSISLFSTIFKPHEYPRKKEGEEGKGEAGEEKRELFLFSSKAKLFILILVTPKEAIICG